MARVGINPARRRQSDYRPARVTVAMLCHIPNFSGYFRYRFEIMKLSLGSILANTARPYDLLVFDNGSCDDVVAYLKTLRDAGDLNYLILSDRNIGKIGAFQLLFRAAPGELVAYSDDDVFFLPGWLEAHLEIVDTFPNVGMVSGLAIRVRFNDQTSSNQAYAAREGVDALRGRFIPDTWEREFAANTGRNWDDYQNQTEAIEDLVLRHKGVEAFATANHFQFLAPRKVILDALPDAWGGQLMGQMVELDRAVDGAGYLRLSTRQRQVRMMGNVVDGQFRELAQSLNPDAGSSGLAARHQRSAFNQLIRSPPVTRAARALYDRLYWFIHQ